MARDQHSKWIISAECRTVVYWGHSQECLLLRILSFAEKKCRIGGVFDDVFKFFGSILTRCNMWEIDDTSKIEKH